MPERIGFVGVGEIARAIVTGLSNEPRPPRIVLSPRGAHVARSLAHDFPGVEVAVSNQAVVDSVDVLLLTLRPDQRDALKDLQIPPSVTVVSALAGVGLAELGDILCTDAAIVRAIPLPAIRGRTSVTAVYPPHPVVDKLFAGLGGTFAVSDEHALSVLTAVTGSITGFLQYVAVIGGWAASNGLPDSEAQKYLRNLFAQLASELSEPARSLPRLVLDHETPGGLNEQLRTSWFDSVNQEALIAAMDAVLRRVGC